DSNTPRGILPPSFRYLSGLRRKSTISVGASLSSTMPATSAKVTCCSAPSTRRARERPKDINPPGPPPPAAAAARRMMKTNNRINNSVGPNPSSSSARNEGPLDAGCALIVTCCSSSWLNSEDPGTNDGIWVENSVVVWLLLLLGG